ncbi:cyclic nucleotide-gated ion channel 18-like [Magnolia sinica]|uniref:cyclic nucleotide-gated ion channel 18-like n=1 Tax=Magnolia sinica TaxID=86752 RepID=UPI0026580657|nr:cyclic nucleotide-gated ion channel 18-like [Magnolia sinica]
MMIKKGSDPPPIRPSFRPFLRSSSFLIRGSWTHHILDPGGQIVTRWNYIFLVSSLVSLFLDPLYFYLPSSDPLSLCLQINLNLRIIVTFFRTVADLFYLVHMVLKFRTAFVAPSSRVLGRGELVMDPRQIAIRYLKSDFLLDLAATLPLPQVVIWLIVPAVKSSATGQNSNTLSLIVLIQYVPRLFLIFPLNRRIVKTNGVVTKTAWAGAAYNLLLYILTSHVLGASWYLLSVERLRSCWSIECAKENGTMHMPMCEPSFLDCNSIKQPERHSWLNTTHVFSNCNPENIDTTFIYGMFAEAVTNEVLSSPFLEKYLYCLWWGLKSLSSYAQGTAVSTYASETSFCILICIVGLVLVAHLVGNMETFLQSTTMRLEEWRVKRRDIEEWMQHRQLPEDLRERVRRFEQYKWLATRGVNEEPILRALPLDLRRDIQRHLCLALVRRVPFFSQMDDQLLDAICERLVSALSTQYTYIVREGDPVNEMLFIIRGKLESSTTNGGRSGFFNSITLKPGDFCGEELLTWALMPDASNLPSSTRTVRALSEVEAFALRSEDLRYVANQFKRLHSKKLQHAFRYYSHQWRTWGSCFIQVAWRRFQKRKLAKQLAKQESLFYMTMQDQNEEYDYDYSDELPLDNPAESSTMDNQNFQHLGATILASRFAKNTKRGVDQKIKMGGPSAVSLKMPKLMKPDEPDFSVGKDDGR